MDKILVIAPHADDEILGCGGTIAKHKQNGDEVFIIIATNASIGAPDLFSPNDVKIIRSEALSAHSLLGVDKTIFFDFPAPSLNTYPEFRISLEISKVIQELRPTQLYLPHPGDLHQDHKAIYRSSLVAARPQNSQTIRNIYTYETMSETEWAPRNESHFIPNHYVDINNYLNLKLEAMACFKSQLKQEPHSRSLETLKSLSRYRGATVSLYAAEAFMVERQISI